jgi:hypothetical protein
VQKKYPALWNANLKTEEKADLEVPDFLFAHTDVSKTIAQTAASTNHFIF